MGEIYQDKLIGEIKTICGNRRNSFIHSDHFYSAVSSPLLLRSAPDTTRILCRSFSSKRHRQLQVKYVAKVPPWRLERKYAICIIILGRWTSLL